MSDLEIWMTAWPEQFAGRLVLWQGTLQECREEDRSNWGTVRGESFPCRSTWCGNTKINLISQWSHVTLVKKNQLGRGVTNQWAWDKCQHSVIQYLVIMIMVVKFTLNWHLKFATKTIRQEKVFYMYFYGKRLRHSKSNIYFFMILESDVHHHHHHHLNFVFRGYVLKIVHP